MLASLQQDGREGAAEDIEVRASLFGSQISLYVGGQSNQEATADNALRVYLEGGVRIRCGGKFFIVTCGNETFRTEEILFGAPTPGQNILDGKITMLPSAVYFMPAGWKMHNWSAAKDSPQIELGKIGFAVREDGKSVDAASGGAGEIATLPSSITASFGKGCKSSVFISSEEIEIRELLLTPEWKGPDGSPWGPAVFFKKANDRKFSIRKLSERPDVRIYHENPPALIPVDVKNALLAHPNPFYEELTVYYFLAREGVARLELYDVFGQPAATLLEEKTVAGAHEMRFGGTLPDESALAPGPYMLKYFVDGREIAKTEIVEGRRK